MCGIAVAIDWPEAEVSVRRLIEGILHRGDVTDPVAVLRKDTAMGTRRLRIVDAEHGIQPQISFNTRLAVAFNGEIYNYLELRKELADLGVEFRTESDTEVLANALQVWGYRALERLVGMYAFVAVDLANGEFLAARDPFGVKPLYVIQSGSSFLCFRDAAIVANRTGRRRYAVAARLRVITQELCALQVADLSARRCPRASRPENS